MPILFWLLFGVFSHTHAAEATAPNACLRLFNLSEQQIDSQLQEEWNAAEKFFKSEKVNISIQKTSRIISDYGTEVVISKEGNHPLNEFARDVFESHKADVIYLPGTIDPMFVPVIVNDTVVGLKILLPFELLSAPINLARTFGALHELRHLMDFLSLFKGHDTAFQGRIKSESKLELPGKIDDTKWGYETAFGFNELRTFFSQLHQQALRLSSR